MLFIVCLARCETFAFQVINKFLYLKKTIKKKNKINIIKKKIANYKKEVLKRDVIRVSLDYLSRTNNLEIKAKTLSIIRLLVKYCSEQTGLDLIFEEKSLDQIENAARNTFDHPIIAGESSRLVCYLPIAAKNEKRVEKMLKFKLVDIICNQLKSDHFIMVNEAVLALNLLVTVNYSKLINKYF